MRIRYCPFCGVLIKDNWKSNLIEGLYGFECTNHGTFVVREGQEGNYIEIDQSGYQPSESLQKLIGCVKFKTDSANLKE